MKIAICKDGQSGFVFYHKGKKQVSVVHPEANVREATRKYLNSPRTFTVGNPDGSRRRIVASPNQHISLMGMALGEMHNYTGISADWDNPDNLEDITEVNIEPDKPMDLVVHQKGGSTDE